MAAAGDNVNAMQSLYRAFHSLAGSAGTFGHSELGRCAKALEKDFEALLDDVAPQPSGTLEPLAPLLQRLKRAAAAPEPRLAGPTTQPNPD